MRCIVGTRVSCTSLKCKLQSPGAGTAFRTPGMFYMDFCHHNVSQPPLNICPVLLSKFMSFRHVPLAPRYIACTELATQCCSQARCITQKPKRCTFGDSNLSSPEAINRQHRLEHPRSVVAILTQCAISSLRDSHIQ